MYPMKYFRGYVWVINIDMLFHFGKNLHLNCMYELMNSMTKQIVFEIMNNRIWIQDSKQYWWLDKLFKEININNFGCENAYFIDIVTGLYLNYPPWGVANLEGVGEGAGTEPKYSRTSMAWTPLEPRKYVRDTCWLVGCFGLNGPLRQYFSLYRAVSQREGREEKR